MSRIKSLLILMALVAQVPLASAKTTYVAGSCEPKLPSYTTIMGALGATPAPNVVEVCPGTYAEQIVITSPVTLEGISVGGSSQAIIAVPPGGLMGSGLAGGAQVSVQNVTGEVSLSNLTVDGTGNNVGGYRIGVLYQNSPGTMNHLTIQNQAGSGFGVGVYLEPGSANPSVTLENSNLQGFDYAGIYAGIFGGSSTSELTATIQGNYVRVGPPYEDDNIYGILLEPGATASVSSNLVIGGAESTGISISGGQGSISKNTVVATTGYIGIFESTAESVPVSDNTILGGAGVYGLFLDTSVSPVTGNTIIAAGLAIECTCTAGDNVKSNTILDAVDALRDVPPTAVTSNKYYNVGTIRGTEYAGGCQ